MKENVSFDGFINKINSRLRNSLPGKMAHLRMVPQGRIPEFELNNAGGKRAAVLLLLYPYKNDVYTVLIRRPIYNGHHSGQIALPGGKEHPDDRDIRDTALREAREEVGIIPQDVQILAALTDLFIPPGNFLLTPILAWQSSRPAFKADQREVAEILEVKVRAFNPANIREKEIPLSSGRVFRTPYYDVNGLTVWGATAMIMSELQEIIQDIG